MLSVSVRVSPCAIPVPPRDTALRADATSGDAAAFTRTAHRACGLAAQVRRERTRDPRERGSLDVDGDHRAIMFDATHDGGGNLVRSARRDRRGQAGRN